MPCAFQMFGPVQKVAHCSRAYPLVDAVVIDDILAGVRELKAACRVYTLQWRDTARMRFENLTVAVNVTGRQGHLVFTTLGGYNIVYLVHLTAGSVVALPLRFADQVHKSNLIVSCTVSVPERSIIVQDVLQQHGKAYPTGQASIVHSLVHELHIPDAALFPLRVVARRQFLPHQVSDIKRFMAASRIHSLSLKDDSQPALEYRVLAIVLKHQRSAALASPGPVQSMHIVKDAGPDAYKLHGSDQYLSVRTMEESRWLACKDFSNPLVCPVWWDGCSWRLHLPSCAAHV